MSLASISNARRSVRELMLAYRIACVRMHREEDRLHLAGYERACDRLLQTLAERTGNANDQAHASITWLGVGAARSDEAVLVVLESLEEGMASMLASLRLRCDSRELRALVERSICASEVRRAWLRAQRQRAA